MAEFSINEEVSVQIGDRTQEGFEPYARAVVMGVKETMGAAVYLVQKVGTRMFGIAEEPAFVGRNSGVAGELICDKIVPVNSLTMEEAKQKLGF